MKSHEQSKRDSAPMGRARGRAVRGPSGRRAGARATIPECAIRDLAARIAAEFHPEKIILFGSYANGTPRPDSDVDFLVVLRFRGCGLEKSVQIAETVKPDFPVDLVVRTPEDLRRRLAWDDFFLQEVVESGRVLYEAAHP